MYAFTIQMCFVVKPARVHLAGRLGDVAAYGDVVTNAGVVFGVVEGYEDGAGYGGLSFGGSGDQVIRD